ncbi:aspartate aminotransferase [Raphidocelis subcapitata]|uniref:Aspartate aminotransferase n=1 Tax=Raphidocelis subcapitata TaxID=307507 RepID=A0A2V0PCT8_9CHLO|nr:aspartate aminotransferase [Raphidocelis subcapitata]|eukprot:GBF95700.1 aspartate aminotransferase [Raphidocelis subcapitata]
MIAIGNASSLGSARPRSPPVSGGGGGAGAQRGARCRAAATVSRRVLDTDAPVIVKTKAMMAGREGVLSLAQGIVFWPPPPAALARASELLASSPPSLHGYGPAEGLPELRAALREKLRAENGLEGYDVMVTAGANQAFVNLVLALCDAGDRAVLFRPWYFNHAMAFQMTGGADRLAFGPCCPATLKPDLDWLQRELEGRDPPKMVVLVNPCNPTGVALSKGDVERAAALTQRAGAWLVLDNTYEQFMFEGRRHHALGGPNIINLFSFSKAYGMMGYRVGYIAWPLAAEGLGAQLLKVQDTIPICPPTLSQHVALAALTGGGDWVRSNIAALAPNRAAIADALSPLAAAAEAEAAAGGRPAAGAVAGGEGAIYFWGRLPAGFEERDEEVVEWLIKQHGVCLIPGSACGAPGHVRAAFANLERDACAEAAARLKRGLRRLAAGGPAVLAGGGGGGGGGAGADAHAAR